MELIDSLPNPETWVERRRRRPAGASSDEMDCEGREPPDSDGGEGEGPDVGYECDLPQNAVRVRCTDADHFDTLLRHYACSKFSEEERMFIDSTVWDDSNSYCNSAFDPRIFQAFIWQRQREDDVG